MCKTYQPWTHFQFTSKTQNIPHSYQWCIEGHPCMTEYHIAIKSRHHQQANVTVSDWESLRHSGKHNGKSWHARVPGNCHTELVCQRRTCFVLRTLTKLTLHDMFNSPPPGAADMRRGTRSALVRVMACYRFVAKPLPEPMMAHCQLDSWEHISVEFWWLYLVPTSTTRLASDVGYRMTKK